MTGKPPIALIAKNKSEMIRVGLDEFNGHHFADIRIVAAPENQGDEPTFTKKGVAVPIRRLPALIDALQTALAQARDRKLFDRPEDRAA